MIRKKIKLKTIIERETQKHAHTQRHTHRVKDSNTPGCSHKEIDSDSNSGDNRIVLIELNLPYVTILKAGEKISKQLCDQKLPY